MEHQTLLKPAAGVQQQQLDVRHRGFSLSAIAQARDAHRRGDFAGIYSATERVLLPDEPPSELHLLRARALLRERRSAEAESLLAPRLGSFADVDGAVTAALLHAAAIARRDPGRGIALLIDVERDAVCRRAHPSIRAEIAYRRAFAHWLRGDHEDAERLARITEAASVDILGVHATQLRGFVAIARGDFADALPFFHRARRAYGLCHDHDVDLATAVLQQIAALEQTLRCDAIPGTHREREGRTIPRSMVGLGGPSGWRVRLCSDDAWLFALDGDADRAYASARDAERFAPTDAWRVRGLACRAAIAAAFDERAAARSFAGDGHMLAARINWNETSDDERFGLLLLAEVLAQFDPSEARIVLAMFDDITTPLASNRILANGRDGRLRGWDGYVRATIARYEGDRPSSARLYASALEAFRESGYRWREAQALVALADIAPSERAGSAWTDDADGGSHLDQAVDLIAQHFPDSFLARRIDGWSRVRLDPHGALLSPAQRDVLRYLLDGHAPREIAALKNRGYETIRTHMRALHRAFGTKSEHQLVAVCAARGIFPPRAEERIALREAAR